MDARERESNRAWFTMVRLLAVVALLTTAAAAFLGYIGYFGGPIFVVVPAETMPAPALRGVSAVLLSGDMGFRIGMGPQIAQRLAADGIPVVGVNSLTYFRQRRSPREAELLVATAIRRAEALPQTRHVMLIGQSFGADMLQTALPALPAKDRSRILLVALVVPGDTVDFRASPSELFSLEAPDALALPTARLLNWIPALCIYGAEEGDSLCPLLDLPNVAKVKLPGGHPLHRDVDAVHRIIISAAEAAARERAAKP